MELPLVLPSLGVFCAGLVDVVVGTTSAQIGFYDGFFDPGTGSFLIFLFIRLYGFSPRLDGGQRRQCQHPSRGDRFL